MKKPSTKKILTTVTAIRRRNNVLWMSLMALAMQGKPRKAKKIIRKIVKNDKMVSKWMSRV